MNLIIKFLVFYVFPFVLVWDGKRVAWVTGAEQELVKRLFLAILDQLSIIYFIKYC